MNPLDRLFTYHSGPMATVRACTLCKHTEMLRKGGSGRGYGMREGNKARGRMIQHLISAHPVEAAAARDAAKGRA